jgi:hypothetical protein
VKKALAFRRNFRMETILLRIRWNNREAGMKIIQSSVFVLALASAAWAQSGTGSTQKSHPGAAHDVATGTGDVATGPVKGAGELAKGTAGAAGDVLTLHPIDAGVSAGKGVGKGGKDVAVGAVKGTGKVVRGVGKTVKKIL